MMGEIVQLWQIAGGPVGVTRVWQACVGIPQLVKEWVDHGIDGRETLCRSVLEQLGDQIDGARVRLAENLTSLCELSVT